MNPYATAAEISATSPLQLHPMQDWLQQLDRLLRSAPVARVVVGSLRGSAPREPGASMLVTAEAIYGTVGGGHLEWRAIAAARELLAAGQPGRVQRYILGTELGQCCGGVVQLWLDRWSAEDRALVADALAATGRGAAPALLSRLGPAGLQRELRSGGGAGLSGALLSGADDQWQLTERLRPASEPLYLFGAGHVGQALVSVLAGLPFTVHWFDPRPGLFPASPPEHTLPQCSGSVAEWIAAAPPNARYVVMTHSHDLDYELCRAILLRGDFAYAGLIGSDSKAARFRSRFAREGLDPAQIARLNCPIGVGGIKSKWPAAIAVSVAAQLLQGLGDAAAARAPLAPGEDCSGSDCAGCDRGGG